MSALSCTAITPAVRSIAAMPAVHTPNAPLNTMRTTTLPVRATPVPPRVLRQGLEWKGVRMRASRIAIRATGVLLVAAITIVIRGQLISRNAASWKEFTIVQRQVTRTLPGGAVFETFQFQAQRSDGSTAEGQAATPSHPRLFRPRHVVLKTKGERVLIDDSARVKTTWFFEPKASSPSADPVCGFHTLSASAKPALKGEENVLGFRTVVIQTEIGHEFLTTVWRAPDLDCTVVKMTEVRRNERGDVTGRFELEPTLITVGPPDAKQFDVPPDYVEKSPVETELARRAGDPRSPRGDNLPASLQQLESRYQENHRTMRH